MWKRNGVRNRNLVSNKRQILFYALVAWSFFSAAYLLSNNLAKLGVKVSSPSAVTSIPASSGSAGASTGSTNRSALIALVRSVLPPQGFALNAKWGGSIKRLVASGALNVSFLSKALSQSGQPITPVELEILNGTYDGNITMSQSNSQFMLYVLWGLGVNNNNSIINKGPIMTYGGDPNNLASTGGYGPVGILQLGKLNILNLTPAQQAIANYTAQNSYRPCCDNPTFFPDCNHGAAALGLIELMASQGASQQEIFAAVEDFNALQFPQQYLYTAAYFASRNAAWADVPAQVAVGINYSSATGSQKTLQYLQTKNLVPSVGSGGSSCGA